MLAAKPGDDPYMKEHHMDAEGLQLLTHPPAEAGEQSQLSNLPMAFSWDRQNDETNWAAARHER